MENSNLGKGLIIEACVTTVDEALKAEKNGANRIELCIDIAADGLTPPVEMIQACLLELQIPTKVLIRPRAGDFVYSQAEKAEIIDSIIKCKELGVGEVVIGALLENGELDIKAISKMAWIAAPMKVCIHKAIDNTPDPVAATIALCQVNHVTGILTSGGASTAKKGAATIRKMIEKSKDKLEITGAGKILAKNLLDHHQLIGGSAYHGRRIVALI